MSRTARRRYAAIKRHVPTCSRGLVLAAAVTAANVHDTQAAGWLLDRAVEAGRMPVPVKADGIQAGARMDEAPSGIAWRCRFSLRIVQQDL